MATYKTLEAAARAHGARLGVTGRTGGWLYRNGVAIAHGWRSWGFQLVDAGIIDPQDAEGNSVRRFKSERGVTIRSWQSWRLNAVQYGIKETS